MLSVRVAKVERLPDVVVDQIAAGEVVERPASVVKELVENALDAESTRVAIDVDGGGLDRIRVADDGTGLAPDDARLALERHATSKLRAVTDLETLRTLGFRGEALPSIASVSRFTLTTTPRGSLGGHELYVEGGRRVRDEPVGAPPGTTIVVEDLFFNVPARRKFLKRPETELSHVFETVVRLALAHPKVGFRLTHNGRQVLDAPAEVARDPRARLGRLLGRETAEGLFPIAEGERTSPVEVRGFVGAPSLSERSTRGLHVLVNGRFVRDRTVQSAIQEAYRTLMERGRYPVVVLDLTIDPRLVDVNVHPQKTEVRFQSSADVFRAVLNAVTRTLRETPWLAAPATAADVLAAARAGQALDYGPRSGGAGGAATARDGDAAWRGAPTSAEGAWSGGGGGWTGGGGSGGARPREVEPWTRSAPFAREVTETAWSRAAREAPSDATIAASLAAFEGGRDATLPPAPGVAPGPTPGPTAEGLPGLFASAESDRAPRARFSALEVVGQVLLTYLVCQGPDRMVLIDQHAAHERVAYERLRRQRADRRLEIQPMLVPEVIELDAVRHAAAADAAPTLAELGFELEPFGGRAWVLKAAPAALGVVDARALVLDLVDELRELGRADAAVAERDAALLSCAACHSVVRAGDALAPAEIRALLAAMDEIDFGAHCPHGRPVFVEFTARELGAMFHRS